jgi:ABC-type multidrug transport system ATPase subunit
MRPDFTSLPDGSEKSFVMNDALHQLGTISWDESMKPGKSSLKFSWEGVSFSVGTKTSRKDILQNVNGCVEAGMSILFASNSGTLLAVMGPSGCGKSTLLNILSRRLTGASVSGDQRLSGVPFDDTTLRSMSTYVEQEDHLIGSLTVRETIDFAAKLALPVNVNSSERLERTEQTLKDFGLQSVKDSKIGTPLQRGISGGQKRRVTTASQLITLPKIIFLGMSTQEDANSRRTNFRVG